METSCKEPENGLLILNAAEQVCIQNISDSEFRLCKNGFGVERYRGGSIEEEINVDPSTIINIAIKNADWHDIKLHHGGYNNADGNCSFESIVQNINSRPCFGEHIPGSADLHRKSWLSETENLVWEFTGGLGLSEDLFRKEWSCLKNSKSYNCALGDFLMHAIAHCVKKDILLFNTTSKSFLPVYVVEASRLSGRLPNSDIPIVVAYNGKHYESLIPDTEEDVAKSIILKKQFLNNNYEKTKADFVQFLTSLSSTSHYESLIPDSDVEVENPIILKNKLLNNDYDVSTTDIKGFLESCKLKTNEESKRQLSYANVVKNGTRKNMSSPSIPVESNICSSKKKIKDMTPQEMKEYKRLKQQARRENEKSCNDHVCQHDNC